MIAHDHDVTNPATPPRRARRVIVLGLALILYLSTSFGALTNLVSETFQGTGIISATAPDVFSSVIGQFDKAAVGPRTPGDTTAASLGWSTALYSNTNSVDRFDLTNGWTQAQSNGCLAGWFYFLPNANLQSTRLINVVDVNGNSCGGLNTATNYLISSGNEGERTLQPIPSYTWLWLATSWHKTGPFNNNYDFQFWCMTNGQSAPSLIHAWVNHNGPASMMVQAQIGNTPAAATARVDGRLGFPILFTFSTNADVAVGPGSFMIEPPETNDIAFYVNPATGNDTNSGVAPDQAWQSMSNISQWATGAGMLGSSDCATGPTLYIDTSGAPLDLTRGQLNLNIAGLNVAAAPGNVWWTNTLDHVLTKSTFTQLPGGSPIWQTSDTQSNIVVWENGEWMYHPNGSTFMSVSNAVAGTNGSFWTDGAALYVNPFAGTSPPTDGNRYTRSVNRGFGGENSAINITKGPINFADCWAGMTCVALPATSDSIGAYVVQAEGNFGNTTNLIRHCHLFYGSKHILGYTYDGSDSQTTTEDVVCDQGSPYFSQTPFVSYTAYATSTNNTHIYLNCQCPHFKGLIGSTVGDPSTGDALYSHNSTGTSFNQFSLIEVEGCNFANNTISAAPAAVNLFVTNSTYGGGVFTSPYKTITGCHIIGGLPANADHTEMMTVNNCLVEYTNRVDISYPGPRQTAGTNLWTGNTIIATPPGGDDFQGGIFHRTDTVNFEFSNNIVVMQGLGPFAILEDFSTNDALLLGDNLYVLTNNLARNYTNASGVADLPFAAWQTNGFDFGSLNVPGALHSPVSLVCVGNSWVVGMGTSPGTGDIVSIRDYGTNVPFGVVYDEPGGSSIFRFDITPSPDSLIETYTLNWPDYSTNLQIDLYPVQLGLSRVDYLSGFRLTVSNMDGTAIAPERAVKLALYSSTDLATNSSNWNLCTNTPLLTNGVLQIDYQDDGSVRRYWRVLEIP